MARLVMNSQDIAAISKKQPHIMNTVTIHSTFKTNFSRKAANEEAAMGQRHFKALTYLRKLSD